jgi:hypothetical protein
MELDRYHDLKLWIYEITMFFINELGHLILTSPLVAIVPPQCGRSYYYFVTKECPRSSRIDYTSAFAPYIHYSGPHVRFLLF